jgi:hypothetical protein
MDSLKSNHGLGLATAVSSNHGANREYLQFKERPLDPLRHRGRLHRALKAKIKVVGEVGETHHLIIGSSTSDDTWIAE